MTEQMETTHELSIEEAFGLICDPKETNPEKVLEHFQKVVNDTPFDRKDIVILAKNLIMRQLVSDQMKAQRYFEITSPFDSSCMSCKGTGEIYKFNKKPVSVNCHICAGKKKVVVECRKCKGTGRYVERWAEGGGLNIKCTTCKGTGTVRVKCSNCFGRGKIKKIVHDHSIKSTTPCKYCGGLGFIVSKPAPKKKKKEKKRTPPSLGNTVISRETAVILSNMIKR